MAAAAGRQHLGSYPAHSCFCVVCCAKPQQPDSSCTPGFSGADEDPAVGAVINGDSSTVVQHHQGTVLHRVQTQEQPGGVTDCTEQVLLVFTLWALCVSMQQRHTRPCRRCCWGTHFAVVDDELLTLDSTADSKPSDRGGSWNSSAAARRRQPASSSPRQLDLGH